jgi:hypothetical protein
MEYAMDPRATTEPVDSNAEETLDVDAINADIAAGAKALTFLLNHASDDFSKWVHAIRGLSGLRDLAFAKAQTRDIKSWHYRQQLGAFLQMRKHAVYDRIDKQTRSSCYKLMDRIDDIRDWYIALPASDQLRWKHPDSVAKHCPRHLLSGGGGHNKPKKKQNPKKPLVSAETERLKKLLIQVIRRLMKYEPEAAELLDEVMPADNAPLDDSLDDISIEELDAKDNVAW